MADGVNTQATLIFGGQIAGERPGLYMIYPLGNAIAASPETPYLQIGESKYGKPILDRILSPATRLEDAARTAIVSLDSTIRSSLSVGLPIDLALLRDGNCASASSCGWVRIPRCMRTSTRTGRGGWNRRWTPCRASLGNRRTVVPAAGRQPR
jgi:putative proteasome-type protease